MRTERALPAKSMTITFRRYFALRSKAGTDPAHFGAHLCREELSLDLDARHLTRHRRQSRRPLSLLQIQGRAAFSNPGSLFRTRAGTVGSSASQAINDPFEKLRIFIDNHLSFFAANMAEMKVLSHEAESLAGDLHEHVSGRKRQYTRTARKILSEVQQATAGNSGRHPKKNGNRVKPH